MPLPHEALTVTGGCNCGAIRYRIAIPAADQRPTHFAVPEDAQKESPLRMPLVIADHCNDCRSATSSILPTWILTPEAMFTMSCLPKAKCSEIGSTIHGSALETRSGESDSHRPSYTSGYDILCGRDEEARNKTWLCVYFSTESKNSRYGADAARSFCGRCGTNVAYVVDPFPFPGKMVDVILGTVDRPHLENEHMGHGLGPKHPRWNPMEDMKDL